MRMLAAHERALRRTAARFSPSPEDAEDVFQRALEIVLTKAPVADEVELTRWTHTVIRHEAFAVRRLLSRTAPASAVLAREDPGADPLELIASDLLSPDERYERSERVARSCEALAALKPHEVTALLLKAEGYSYAEIGEITGWSYTKINRCMAEGRKRFFTLIDQSESGERCDGFDGALSRWIDGELSRAEVPQLKSHLAACAHCRAKVAVHRGLNREVLQLWPPVAPLAYSGWSRIQEWLVGGLGDRVAAVTLKGQQLIDVAVAKKAAAATAVAVAAVAGGEKAVKVTDPPKKERSDRSKASVSSSLNATAGAKLTAPTEPSGQAPQPPAKPGAQSGSGNSPAARSSPPPPPPPSTEFRSQPGPDEFGGTPEGPPPPRGGEFESAPAPAAPARSPSAGGGGEFD